MEVTLEIKDSKAASLMEVLKALPYVKVKKPKVRTEKEELIEDIKAAVEEMKLIRAGKLQARDARELLNEL